MYNMYVHGIHLIIGTYIQQVYTTNPFLQEQIKVFEANNVFYSLIDDTTKIISAACFIQFINLKSKEYFGYCIS